MKTHTLLLVALLFCGCRKAMVEDGHIKPLEESHYFANGTTARTPVEGTVPRGQLQEDTAFYQGEIAGRLVTGFPMRITKELLTRGQERFDIYCAVCHGRTGAGNGMIVQRGFPAPPTYHQKRLRDAPPGYFFGVITRGYGVMYSYADRVPPADRWAITAYIRALQRSQDARWNDVPEAERKELPQ
ncbi:MAG: cytochrome c [Verrucomicrobia bacterium]|nr:cytochrome c [Verrucomicrobiota bacterium]